MTRHGHLATQLGDGLRAARTTGMDRLAKAHGLAKNTIREVEVGVANPTLKRIEDLEVVYGVDIAITVTPRSES